MIRRKGFLLAFAFLGLALFSLSAFNVNNTFAITPTVNLQPTGTIYTPSQAYYINSSNQIIPSSGGVTVYFEPSSSSVVTNPEYPIIRGIGDYSIRFYDSDNYYTFIISAQSSSRSATDSLLWYPSTSSDFDLISFEEISSDSVNNYSQLGSYWDIGSFSKFYEITVKPHSDGNYRIQFGDGLHRLFYLTVYDGAGVSFNLGLIREFSLAGDELNKKDDEDRQNLENQSSDTQSSSDDSQQEAESTGTTLLSAFTSFIGALSSASPSNCRINMDLGNFDMGNVDLCSLSPPSEFQSIASIMLILFCVPLSIATARKVINLFRSFQ